MITVRIERISLRNFKNVRYGSFVMPSFLNKDFHSADIVGIYGQNGSGKTAIINAFDILRCILSGGSLSDESSNLINIDSTDASIELGLVLDRGDEFPDRYKYTLTFTNSGKKAILKSELLEVRKSKRDGSFERERAVLGYDYESHEIKPDATFRKIIKGNRNRELDLLVASRMAEKSESSLLFSSDGAYEILTALSDGFDEFIAEPVKAIRAYAEVGLIVISTREMGINSSLMMDLAYRMKKNGQLIKGHIPLSLDKPSVLGREEMRTLDAMVKEMNTVLSAIVPHLTLGLYTTGEELTAEGKKGYSVEIVSLKNGKAIPLRYESEGIIKIISITNVLLCVYNNPSVCLIIDEFDASVFEYLLGELISIFSKGAKGQMIFTSHNLRILEMIDKDSIIFSTANPDNRYIRMTNIKSTNNLRDVYIRSLLLGTSNENIYEETDSQEIGMALRRAWRGDEE